MASRPISSTSRSAEISPSLGAEIWEAIKTILKPLASLRLTVVLFALAIIVVLFGTLAQDKKDMWEVVDQYFRSFFVWVELSDLFPSAWFPGMRFAVFDLPVVGQTPIGFPFLGGAAIGLAMFVNLLAAHLVRFKIQSRGVRLWSGLAVIALGSLAIFLVIQSGHNQGGLQGEPAIGGEDLWLALKIGVGLAMLGLFAGLGYTATIERYRFRSPMWILAACVVIGLAASAWVFGPGADLGQDSSSMRILWQLIKAQAASIVLMIGCWIAFKQRGGIVLIHAGVGLMMIGEVLVGSYAVEEQIAMFEGESVNYASDIRAVELAVIDASPESHDNVVAIPTERNGSVSRFVEQGLDDKEPIDHPDLPFAIEFVKYLRNANFREIKASDENPADKGVGLKVIAEPIRPGASADGNSAVDQPAAYFTLYEKSKEGAEKGKPLGTYLAHVFLRNDEVEVGGKKYTLALRYKRTYKPYTMRLIDVRKDDYLGTDTPRNYSSDVHLIDPSRNEDRDLHIWMNNPVRYAGETFYQSSYNRDQTGLEGTVLQVVGNTGWMIPYTACMMVFTGMAVHFSAILLRFLNRREIEVFGASEAPIGSAATPPVRPQHRPAKPAAPAQPLIQRVRPASAMDIVVPAIVVLLFGIVLVYSAMPKRAKEKQPDLPSFGKLPIAYEGRVKPFDTVARTSLRAISGKETFTDDDDNRQPAMLWLLDVIANTPAANQHEVFRIEHFDVLSLFDLKRRPGYRYSIAELTPKIEEFERQVRLAGEASRDNPEGMSLYQKKVLELDRKLRLYLALSKSHQLADASANSRGDSNAGGDQPLNRLNRLNELMSLSQELAMAQAPLAAPFPPGEQGWEPLTAAAARQWIGELAKEKNAKSSQDLATKLLRELEEPLLESQMLSDIRAILAQQKPDLTGQALDDKAREMLEAMPAEIRSNLDRASREKVREGLAMATNQFAAMFDETLAGAPFDEPVRPHAKELIGMLTAYRDGDIDGFNKGVAAYHKLLDEEPPPDFDRGRANFEAFFNRFNPYLQCEIMYLVAFVLACLAWLVWRRPLNWASLALIIFALAIHTAALVGRIYIYGRPPVTNLYSSAIFIGWGAVLLGVILEAFYFIGVGNIVAAIAGFSTLLIAPSLAADGDTFTVMQAVLDTNFWLATHVVTITLGYATTFVAGILGVLFVAGGVFTPKLTADHKRSLYRMTYGVVCFAILFSFVGTVLGGLWADDSWGRFWGWDPKENGALIIVLWNAIVLHARWGGLVKERGLAVLAIGGNIVTAWSWFGVNELGVGLHSYGFTEGRLVSLAAFMAANLALICFGLIPKAMWWSNRRLAEAPAGR